MTKPGLNQMKWYRKLPVSLAAFLLALSVARAEEAGFGPPISVPHDLPAPGEDKPRNWIDQTPAEAHAKSAGCLECHKGIDEHTMHTSPNVVLGCTDCHGGNPTSGLTMRKAQRAAAIPSSGKVPPIRIPPPSC